MIHRNLDCEIDEDKKRDGYYYNCSIMPLFELGSLHHDYYLVNLRIPSAFDYEGQSVNVDSKIGKLVDLWLVGIHQVWSLSGLKVSWQVLRNNFSQVSSVSLLMTASTALANEGLFELTRRPSLTRAVSSSFAEGTRL